MRAYEGGVPSGQKRRRKTWNEEVNELTLRWFTIARSKNIPESGPMLQEKALAFAAEMGNLEFKASNGWLEAFRKRNGISFSCLSGESADVNDVTVAEWKNSLPTLCTGFSPADVSNRLSLGNQRIQGVL